MPIVSHYKISSGKMDNTTLVTKKAVLKPIILLILNSCLPTGISEFQPHGHRFAIESETHSDCQNRGFETASLKF